MTTTFGTYEITILDRALRMTWQHGLTALIGGSLLLLAGYLTGKHLRGWVVEALAWVAKIVGPFLMLLGMGIWAIIIVHGLLGVPRTNDIPHFLVFFAMLTVSPIGLIVVLPDTKPSLEVLIQMSVTARTVLCLSLVSTASVFGYLVVLVSILIYALLTVVGHWIVQLWAVHPGVAIAVICFVLWSIVTQFDQDIAIASRSFHEWRFERTLRKEWEERRYKMARFAEFDREQGDQ